MRQASLKAVASFTYLSSLLSSLLRNGKNKKFEILESFAVEETSSTFTHKFHHYPRSFHDSMAFFTSGLGKIAFLDHSIWILSRQERRLLLESNTYAIRNTITRWTD